MRSCWIDEGSGAVYEKLRHHGMERLFFSPNAHGPGDVAEARREGFSAGIYRVFNGGMGPVEFAKLVSQDVTNWGGNNSQLAVQVDIEQHDPDWIKLFLKRWRMHRPLRETSWTMEGFQGGWMASIRQEIISSRVTLTPQCYGGDMTEWDSAGTFKDLVDYGFPYQRIDLFYDAQKLRRGWHGYAFTQDRLP